MNDNFNETSSNQINQHKQTYITCYLGAHDNLGYLGHDGKKLVVLKSPSGEQGKWLLLKLQESLYMISTPGESPLYLSHANGQVSLTSSRTKEEKWHMVIVAEKYIDFISTPEGYYLDISSPDFLSYSAYESSNMWIITRV